MLQAVTTAMTTYSDGGAGPAYPPTAGVSSSSSGRGPPSGPPPSGRPPPEPLPGTMPAHTVAMAYTLIHLHSLPYVSSLRVRRSYNAVVCLHR